MALKLYLSGFFLTPEDWDSLDEETRELFTQMLAEEGRQPRFEACGKPLGLSLLRNQ